jgi:D-3-phosphoglycerate dehydrogenase / 2-oxoglutarate reductase
MVVMRILNLEPDCYPEDLLDRLREVGTVALPPLPDQDALLHHLAEHSYDALFVRLGCSIGREVFTLQPELRFVVTPTTGLNHIDLAEAERRGVSIVSLAGETEFLDTIRSTAEHTWALLLALVRRLPVLVRQVRDGSWERRGQMAGELDGQTLGIVGYGRLGRMIGRYGSAFGMRVLAHDRDPHACDGHAEVTAVALDQLLAESDVVTLHITGSAENHGFLDASRIGRIKPGAVLINTARGEVVEESALLAALRSGHLAGAALDVLAGDSSWDGAVPFEHPLVAYARSHDNLLITPHTGGYGSRSIRRTRAFVTDRFLERLRTGPDRSLQPTPNETAP